MKFTLFFNVLSIVAVLFIFREHTNSPSRAIAQTKKEVRIPANPAEEKQPKKMLKENQH